MNNERRKRIRETVGKIDGLLALRDDLESIRDDEQEAFDNMSESLQGGEKGERAQEAIDALETLINAFAEVESYKDDLENAIG